MEKIFKGINLSVSNFLECLGTYKDNFIPYSNHSGNPTKQEAPTRTGEMSIACFPGLMRGNIRKLCPLPGS